MTEQVAGWIITGASITGTITVVVTALLLGMNDVLGHAIRARLDIRMSEEQTKREALKLGVPVPRERFTLHPRNWKSMLATALTSGAVVALIELVKHWRHW